MASLGQYQSFALIAYDAIRRQADNMAQRRNIGQNVLEQNSLLYNAKKLTDVVLSYSTGSLSSATPRYVAKTAPIGTPVTAVNQYGDWTGIITIFDPSLTIVLTLFVPADLLGDKDAVVNYWNEEYPDSGWVMGYEIVQYAIAPNVEQFVYTMTSPLGYGQDYTGYSFEFIQYEGGVDAEQNSPLDFFAASLIALLPSSGKIQFYYTIPVLYEDSTFVNYNTIQDIIDKVFETTGFTFTLISFVGTPRILIKSPLNSFDFFNGVNFDFNYYVDPNSPPSAPDNVNTFGLSDPIGVAPTQEIYSGSFSKSPIYPAKTENDIIAICNWLQRNLEFTTVPIPQLEPTTLNG
jgi:hypothetical protein